MSQYQSQQHNFKLRPASKKELCPLLKARYGCHFTERYLIPCPYSHSIEEWKNANIFPLSQQGPAPISIETTLQEEIKKTKEDMQHLKEEVIALRELLLNHASHCPGNISPQSTLILTNTSELSNSSPIVPTSSIQTATLPTTPSSNQ